MIYYMVTGKNSSGVLINDKQQITAPGSAAAVHRRQRLVLPRRRSAWARSKSGKLGDVVALSDDYFDPKKVPDEAIKKLKSVLTVVDGKVVYDKLKP